MSTPATVPCPDCGTPARATGQSFCDSCGAFLRWTPSATAPTPDASTYTPSSEAAPADEHRPASTSKAGGTPTGDPRAAATPAEEPAAPAPRLLDEPRQRPAAPDAAAPEAANPAEPATPASAQPASPRPRKPPRLPSRR